MALAFTNSQETIDVPDSNREDLTDLIYMLSPTETPFMMMAGRGSCSATKHEWLMDELSAASDNAVQEGLKIADADVDAVLPPPRLANHTQIWQKSISITGTMEVVNKAGRSSELSYQLAKKAKELKRDMEFTHVGQTTVANMASVAGATRRSAAVQAQFHADWTTTGTTLIGININRGAGGADGGFVEATDLFSAPTDGTQRPLLESMLKGVIQGAWTNGGDPTIIMTGPFNKTTISTFTGNSTRFDRGEDKRLVAAVDIYESDFGVHKVVPNRFQRDRDVLVLTPELYTMCYLRPFRQHALSKVGDSEERTLLCEGTMKYANNAGSGIVADCTTS